jgi:DNA-binding NtrC family response regulator
VNQKLRKIIVIDDSVVIRRTVKDMLAKGNFEVLEAKDGAEGWNLICSENPNLIMLDFILPKMNGWQVYQEIQKQQKLTTIPLVLMSGRKDEVTGKISEPFQHFAFIEKPFDQKQLLDGIKEAMVKAEKRKQEIQQKGQQAKTTIPPGAPSEDTAKEIAALKQKVATMEAEINALKQKLDKVLRFIQQKLK